MFQISLESPSNARIFDRGGNRLGTFFHHCYYLATKRKDMDGSAKEGELEGEAGDAMENWANSAKRGWG